MAMARVGKEKFPTRRLTSPMAQTLPVPTVAAFTACKSQADLAKVLGTSKPNLLFHLYSKAKPKYKSFKIPKASGASRDISVPPRALALWQELLHSILSELYIPKTGAEGFIVDRGILSNARRHTGRQLVLNIDIENFFPSIHFGRVQGMFQKFPFSFPVEVAATLAQLCTQDGMLPQGAPSSPMVSNFICRRLDNDLLRLAKKRHCSYSRYADDITFSTKGAAFAGGVVESFDAYGTTVVLGSELTSVIAKHQFSVNPSKTRVRTRFKRQEVTGLTVNTKPNVSRRYVRDLRAAIHDWKSNGAAAAEANFQALDASRKTRRGAAPGLAKHLRGKLEFLRMIRGTGDPLHAKYALAAAKLPGYHSPARIEGRASEISSFFQEALWVVVGYDAQGQSGPQGTAFELEGFGIVSALHTIDPHDPQWSTWKLVQPCPPYAEFPILGYHRHAQFDMTVLETGARSAAILRQATDLVAVGDPLVVLGFPNWHTTADQPLRVLTVASQTKTVSAVKLVSVGYPLLTGASGGPVLDRSGRVCGVVVRSVLDTTFPNSFISIDHLPSVVAAPVIVP
jgi:RNA-directed DNA polymerase